MRRHEINDVQWSRVAPLLSGKSTDCGVTGKDNRLFFNAVVWLMRTGVPWADLPERFGKANTVSKRFRRMAKKGVWERAFQALQNPELDWVMLDRPYKVTQTPFVCPFSVIKTGMNTDEVSSALPGRHISSGFGLLVGGVQLCIDGPGFAVANDLPVQQRDGQHFFGGGRQQQLVSGQYLSTGDTSQLKANASAGAQLFKQAVAYAF